MNFKSLRARPAYAGSTVDPNVMGQLATSISEMDQPQSSIARSLFVTESVDDATAQRVDIALSGLDAALAAALSLSGKKPAAHNLVAESIGRSAAVVAGMAAMADSMVTIPTFVAKDTEGTYAISAQGVPNYVGRRPTLVAEAFDNRETRSAVLYSMMYNYTMSQQDEFGETLYPTLTLPATDVGFAIVVNRLTVHRGVQHGIEGKAVDFNKIDLMRAGVNPNILQRDKTRCIPRPRAGSEDKFVDPALVAPFAIEIDGEEITTGMLATGEEVGLVGLSQSGASLSAGNYDQTDTLDPAISLETLAIAIGAGNVVRFNVYGHAGANFTYAPQGEDKLRILNYRSNNLALTADTKNVDGAALSAPFDKIAANNLSVFLKVQASGTANTERGSAEVYHNTVRLQKIINRATGELLDPSSATYQDIEAALANAKIIGWYPRAYLTNINMRERGDFLDRTSFTQLYEVPLLSPVTTLRPQNTSGEMDTSDFDALIVHTRFRMKNDVVTHILQSVDNIHEHVKSGSTEPPKELGAARFHVKPVCYKPADAIDMMAALDSIQSENRIADLQAAILNIIRDAAFRMGVDSEYQSAADAMGMVEPATIIVATDPIIARYIMADGDLRTLTDRYKIRVVSTLDERFRGKVFLTFGVFGENRNAAPHILNWGNLVWAQETVMSAQVTRGDRTTRETIVQPRYLFVNHLPVCALLEFTNVDKVFGKIAINFNEL